MLFCRRKEDNKVVNIFQELNSRITACTSTFYKTYCFAFQKRLFCVAKQPLSQCQIEITVFL
ncbi:hypothetical protein BWX39_04685 [Prevotella intermedia ATCC 25611 = DSM 20706]|nr:hypothetical protein BWX39_04685 [Prevotella intermedia ATCC 25611 = DSM 20706]